MSFMKNFKTFQSKMTKAWSNVVTSTENLASKVAKDMPLRNPYKDVGELNFTYVTKRIAAMGFPSSENTRIQSKNKASEVASMLNARHKGHYMIWNLSEESYDTSVFDNQVIEYKFPGHPAPPLGLMFKLCASMENWLEADPKNIVVVHCMSGKGRTAVVIAALLAWIGEQENPMEALRYVCKMRGSTLERLTLPSQRRYVEYFANMMEGVKPRSSPLVLRRVIVNNVPDYSAKELLALPSAVQEWKAAVLLHLAPESEGGGPDHKPPSEADGTHWYRSEDGAFKVNVDLTLQGDILLRMRHVGDSGMRTTMFRIGFHTGYVPDNVLRFSKEELDVACEDTRVSKDFFVELIFSPVTVDSGQEESKSAQAESVTEGTVAVMQEDFEAYEKMLRDESSFWEDIYRKKKQRERERAQQREAAERKASTATATSSKTKASTQASGGSEAKTNASAQFVIAEDGGNGDDEEDWLGEPDLKEEKKKSKNVETPPAAALEEDTVDDTVAASMALLAEIDELEAMEGEAYGNAAAKPSESGSAEGQGGGQGSSGAGSSSSTPLQPSKDGEGNGTQAAQDDDLDELESFLNDMSGKLK